MGIIKVVKMEPHVITKGNNIIIRKWFNNIFDDKVFWLKIIKKFFALPVCNSHLAPKIEIFAFTRFFVQIFIIDYDL